MGILPEIEAIQKGWEKHVLNIKPPREPKDADEGRDYLYAGSRRACRRRMVLEATKPSYFPDFDVDAKARFIRGEQREIDLRQALERVGQLSMPSFTVEGQQERVMLTDRKGRKVIAGKKDCAIRWESRARWSVEFKSWSVFITDRIHTFADLMLSPWTRSGAFQLLSYIYAKDEPFGLLVLDRPGLPRLIPVRLEEHLGLMEEFLIDAEVCVDHIEAETLPNYIDDPEECKRCPVFGSYCQPPLKYDGSSIVTDEELLARVAREIELKEAAAEYKRLHEENSDYFRSLAVKGKAKSFIVGGSLVNVTWQRNTTLDMPDGVKAQYQVSDPSGKCIVKAVKL